MIRNKGFTLIELLVAIAVFFLATAGMYVGFSSFNKNQSLNVTTDTLKNNLNAARSNAISQVSTRNECNQDGRTLAGHRVRFINSDPNYYQLQEGCSLGINPPQYFPASNDIKRIYLPQGVRFESPPANVTFMRGTGETTSASTITVTLRNGSSTKSINIDSSGVISSN